RSVGAPPAVAARLSELARRAHDVGVDAVAAPAGACRARLAHGAAPRAAPARRHAAADAVARIRAGERLALRVGGAALAVGRGARHAGSTPAFARVSAATVEALDFRHAGALDDGAPGERPQRVARD